MPKRTTTENPIFPNEGRIISVLKILGRKFVSTNPCQDSTEYSTLVDKRTKKFDGGRVVRCLMKGNNKQMSEAGSVRSNAHRRRNLGAGKPAGRYFPPPANYLSRVCRFAITRFALFEKIDRDHRLLEIHREREMTNLVVTNAEVASLVSATT